MEKKTVSKKVEELTRDIRETKFTWQNKQEGSALIKELIDRAIAYASLMETYPRSLVKNLRTKESDHCSHLAVTENTENKANRNFRYFQAWTTDSYCK